jgi:hypothetical protein
MRDLDTFDWDRAPARTEIAMCEALATSTHEMRDRCAYLDDLPVSPLFDRVLEREEAARVAATRKRCSRPAHDLLDEAIERARDKEAADAAESILAFLTAKRDAERAAALRASVAVREQLRSRLRSAHAARDAMRDRARRSALLDDLARERADRQRAPRPRLRPAPRSVVVPPHPLTTGEVASLLRISPWVVEHVASELGFRAKAKWSSGEVEAIARF